MAVVLTYNSQIKPGRRLEAIALAGEAAKLIERHGGGQTRLLLTEVAGEQISAGSFVIQFDTLAAYAAFADETATDTEVQSLGDRAAGPDSPVIPQAQILAVDLPGSEATSARGNVVEVHIVRANPGGLDALFQSTQQWSQVLQANGALATRAMRISHGGSQTDLYVSVAEYASHQAWAQATDAFNNSAEGQQLAAALGTEKLPIQLLSSSLYVDVPL
jgi:hypothetical protein